MVDDPKRVTFVGIGPMGAAMASVCMAAGIPVCVWNRTFEKCADLIRQGAIGETDLAMAIARSDITVICLSNHQVSQSVLRQKGVASALKDKTLIQLSTVTPSESLDLEDWVRKQQARYLDGAVMGLPERVLEGNCVVAYSGESIAYEKSREILECIGRRPLHVSDRAGSAPTLELARFIYAYGSWLAYFQGIALCHAAGVPETAYMDVASESEGSRARSARFYGENIVNGTHANPSAALVTHAEALKKVVDFGKSVQATIPIAEVILGYMRQAIAQGCGQSDLSIIFDFMEPDRDTAIVRAQTAPSQVPHPTPDNP